MKNESVKADSKKDTVKAVLHKESTAPPDRFRMPIDTVINKDTLKVIWYQNGLVKCSLNGLSDTITNLNVSWDSSFIYYRRFETDRILLSDNTKPQKFILNDKVLLINLVDWKGRANLFLLNRTKTTLKFAREDDHNPICQESAYVYVDLKHNYIFNHDDQDRYEHGENTSNDAPYWIHRYKIMDKHFMQTDLDTSFFKEFLKIDVNDINGARIFYDIIARRENWKRDKYVIHD